MNAAICLPVAAVLCSGASGATCVGALIVAVAQLAVLGVFLTDLICTLMSH